MQKKILMYFEYKKKKSLKLLDLKKFYEIIYHRKKDLIYLNNKNLKT